MGALELTLTHTKMHIQKLNSATEAAAMAMETLSKAFK